jgi:isoleucyl-tRNA synthetase
MSQGAGSDQSVDYKDTVFLPETSLPMRAGLPKKELEISARWAEMDLYRRQREHSSGRPRYELHDGPPYANGNLHIGHALNKVLKDVVVRSHQMLGFDSRYIPGWDCHGLPIEWKIEEQYRAQGKNKDAVLINDFRQECRRFAAKWIDIQRAEFKRLGVEGDWSKPYTTMAFRAEATIAREFMKFLMNGTLYRGSKPVMWSPIEKTALAEAEVEYHDHESHTIWVRFGIDETRSTALAADLLDANIVIWTTTPWTIPSNRGIAFNAQISYGLYEVTEAPADNWTVVGDKVVLADALAEATFVKARVEAHRRLRTVAVRELANLVCKHPFSSLDEFWDFDVVCLGGAFVTDEAGTGFVHVAPSHGTDDFELFAKNNMLDRITHNVDADGAFADHVPFLAQKRILKPNGKEGDANKAVIEKLVEAGALMARGKIKHAYPHSWRSKAPLIFRNTPQWFVAIDKPIESDNERTNGKTIRDLALKSIDQDVRWVPQTGRNRLYAMIAQRPDWVLSRQRAWGVPLTVFMRRKIDGGVERVELLRDAAVNARIEAAFQEEGADAWFRDDAKARFLGEGYAHDQWEKVDDILDVWFDSGSTHAFVMEERQTDPSQETMWPASIYLEGTDQHRGWFHSSLLESCGTRGRAPYDCVLTHGFVLDGKGQKMSKALGNGVAPQDVQKQYGADIFRLWVMQSNFTEDLRIGPEILKNVADSYRRLRNTFRYMLGALNGFDEPERLPFKEMPELERLMLHRLAELEPQVARLYQDFEYAKLFTLIFNFCTSDLSAFYFDVRKDALYCDGETSIPRRAARTVMDEICNRLTIWLSPMLVFTMEDIWLTRLRDRGVDTRDASVHLIDPETTPAAWRNNELARKWQAIRAARKVVTGALEVARRDKVIGSSLEAAPIVYVADPAMRQTLEQTNLTELSITSNLTITAGDGPHDAFRLDDVEGVAIEVRSAKGKKCARCWKVLPDVGAHQEAGTCRRCSDVVASQKT